MTSPALVVSPEELEALCLDHRRAWDGRPSARQAVPSLGVRSHLPAAPRSVGALGQGMVLTRPALTPVRPLRGSAG
jgi:hypothetical protein